MHLWLSYGHGIGLISMQRVDLAQSQSRPPALAISAWSASGSSVAGIGPAFGPIKDGWIAMAPVSSRYAIHAKLGVTQKQRVWVGGWRHGVRHAQGKRRGVPRQTRLV